MLKVIISGQRTQELSREAFFKHLLNHHAPLVKKCAALERCLIRYVQNHVRSAEDGIDPPRLFDLQPSRDSVIELWCTSLSDLQVALSDPEYLATIRPDEQYFTDQSSLIVLLADEEEVYQDDETTSSYKCFDFLKLKAGTDATSLINMIKNQTARLTVNPGLVHRRVINQIRQSQAATFVEAAAYEVVVENWVGDLTRFGELHMQELSELLHSLDSTQSMTLYAEEFEIMTSSVL